LKIEGTTILTDPVFSTRAGLNFGLFTLGVKRLMAPALAISMRGQAHPDSRTSGFQSLGAAGKSAGKSACATVKALSADENCKLAQYDHAAVHLGVHNAGCRQAANEALIDPITIISGGPTDSAMSVTRACGNPPVSTAISQGGRMGPPTCGMGGTPGVTIGHM
jgi:hypothetical protein